MRIKDGYVLRKIADEYIVVAVGEKVTKFSGMMSLNEISAEVWSFLQEDRTFDELLVMVLSLYDIDEDKARNDLVKLIAKLESIGVIEQ